MRRALVVLAGLCLVSVPAFAGAGKAAAKQEKLATLDLGEIAFGRGPVLFRYVPSLTTIVNKPIPNEAGWNEIRVAKIRLSAASKDTLIVDYTEGASADPGFVISLVEARGPRALGKEIWGLELEAPGDGCFYVKGHTDSWFDMRRKFVVDNRTLLELKQPFYYVGLETKTLTQIRLSAVPFGQDISAVIDAGSAVTVVICDGDNNFLVKTDHDFLGWWRPQSNENGRATEIEGIFFAGD